MKKAIEDLLIGQKAFFTDQEQDSAAPNVPKKILKRSEQSDGGHKQLEDNVDQLVCQFVEPFLFSKKQLEKTGPAPWTEEEFSCNYC